jgi:hypothetical protein
MKHSNLMREEIGKGYFRLNVEPASAVSHEQDSEVHRMLSTYFEGDISTPMERASTRNSDSRSNAAAAHNPSFYSTR